MAWCTHRFVFLSPNCPYADQLPISTGRLCTRVALQHTENQATCCTSHSTNAAAFICLHAPTPLTLFKERSSVNRWHHGRRYLPTQLLQTVTPGVSDALHVAATRTIGLSVVSEIITHCKCTTTTFRDSQRFGLQRVTRCTDWVSLQVTPSAQGRNLPAPACPLTLRLLC